MAVRPYWLEAALERGVAFDVLPELIEGRSADALQFPTSEGRLEDVRGIDRALRSTRADEHVELVDEEDAVACALNLFDDLLQALFEFAAVLGTGDERTDVERDEPLTLEGLRHIATDNALGEQLRDCSLANAWFADEHGVVLGPAGKDLDDALQLVRAANNRVELVVAGGLGEVGAELIDGGGARRLSGSGAGGCSACGLGGRLAEDSRGFAANTLEVHAKAFENPGSDAFTFSDKAEEEVFGADVAMREPACFVDGEFDDLLRPWRKADFTENCAVAPTDNEFDSRANLVQFDSEIGEDLRGHAIALAHQAQENVLGADVVMVEAMRFFLRKREHTPRSFGEFIEPIGHVLLQIHWVRPGNDYEPPADSSSVEGAAAFVSEPSDTASLSATGASAVASEES